MREIFERVSIRKYQERRVEAEKMELLLRAGMAAPSTKNQQPWEFIVVEDKETLVGISQCSNAAPAAKNAVAAIVLLCNLDRVEGDERWWYQDMSAAAQNILLEAKHLGLGAVWLGMAPLEERMQKLAALLNIPANIVPFAVIALGYPLVEKPPHDRFDPERIHHEKY